jgi:hypothetical protein
MHYGQKFHEDWLDAAQTELRDALKEAGNLEEEEEATRLFTLAQAVLTEAAPLYVGSPTIDVDHNKNIEFFWKTESEGLLAVVRLDGSIHFFGNSEGESWRSNYLMSGHVWRKHLMTLLGPFRRDAKHT